jgi:hypothetical protein
MAVSLLHPGWSWHSMTELMDCSISGLLRANTSSHAVLFCSIVFLALCTLKGSIVIMPL